VVVGREAEMREAGLQKVCGWQRPKVASRIRGVLAQVGRWSGNWRWLARPKSKIKKE
jgi:hypothetical protein